LLLWKGNVKCALRHNNFWYRIHATED
jgi:hypothetical protein